MAEAHGAFYYHFLLLKHYLLLKQSLLFSYPPASKKLNSSDVEVWKYLCGGGRGWKGECSGFQITTLHFP